MTVMKTYTYEGKEYVESGVERLPRVGDIYVEALGHANRASINFSSTLCKILIPKEQKVSEVKWKGAKYVLIVKAFTPSVSGCVNRILQVENVHDKNDRYAFDTAQVSGGGSSTMDTRWAWPAECALPLPDCTEEVFNAHWGIEPPKPDTLPAPVRAALDAENRNVCDEARRYVRNLVEAIYQNPPKVSP